MKNFLQTLLLLIVFFLGFPLLFNQAWAGFLKFDKTTVSVANNETFQIAVIVDPGSDSLNSVDVYVTFDATALKVTDVTAGSLFPTVSNDVSTAGKVYIAGLVNTAANSISTSGTLATITFQALKNGTATLSFDCNTSKIVKNDLNASNVIICSSNGTSTVTIGSSGGNNQPTAVPPNQLPQSGVFDNVVKLAVPGLLLFLVGGAFRLLL